ncbi:MAG: hypothetical protein V1646_02235 [bacterium]
MNKKKLVMAFACLLWTSLFGATEYPDTIKDIDDIPDMCAYLMMNLFQQKCDQFDRSRRSLSIKYLIDGEICAFLTLNIGLGLSVCASRSLHANELILLPSEGTLDCKDDIYVRLKRIYINAIQRLKMGWIFIESGESGSLAYPNMPKSYLAFSKTKQLQGEADLIMSLAKKFGFNNEIIGSDFDRFPGENEKIVYLWVKSDAKQRFDRIFKFKHI